jgi:hypothetical protein
MQLDWEPRVRLITAAYWKVEMASRELCADRTVSAGLLDEMYKASAALVSARQYVCIQAQRDGVKYTELGRWMGVTAVRARQIVLQADKNFGFTRAGV